MHVNFNIRLTLEGDALIPLNLNEVVRCGINARVLQNLGRCQVFRRRSLRLVVYGIIECWHKKNLLENR